MGHDDPKMSKRYIALHDERARDLAERLAQRQRGAGAQPLKPLSNAADRMLHTHTDLSILTLDGPDAHGSRHQQHLGVLSYGPGDLGRVLLDANDEIPRR
jgi:hypothetical protein